MAYTRTLKSAGEYNHFLDINITFYAITFLLIAGIPYTTLYIIFFIKQCRLGAIKVSVYCIFVIMYKVYYIIRCKRSYKYTYIIFMCMISTLLRDVFVLSPMILQFVRLIAEAQIESLSTNFFQKYSIYQFTLVIHFIM